MSGSSRLVAVNNNHKGEHNMNKARWKNITGEDVADFIIKRMDELDMLATPENEGRKGELTGHNAELLIITDHLRRLNEDREGPKAEPVTYFFLTIEKHRVVVQYDEFGDLQTVPLKTHQNWLNFIAERKEEATKQGLTITVMASSSMDFPSEYSADQRVIDLARAIRSREVIVA